MARYKNISVDIWNNEDFRTLSDQAKTVYFYLATNPNNTSIPGLYRLSEMQAADDLRLDPERKLFESFSKAFDKDFNESFLKAFREAFDECFRKGFVKADWRNRVVWIPGLLSTNIPDTANVARAWAKSIPEIPDCQLKDEALHELILFIESFSKAFHEAFQEALSKALGKPFEITKTKTTNKTITKEEVPSEKNDENLGGDKDHSPSGESSNVEVSVKIMTLAQEFEQEWKTRFAEIIKQPSEEFGKKHWRLLNDLFKEWPGDVKGKIFIRAIVPYLKYVPRSNDGRGKTICSGYNSFIKLYSGLRDHVYNPNKAIDDAARQLQRQKEEDQARKDADLLLRKEKQKAEEEKRNWERPDEKSIEKMQEIARQIADGKKI